MTDTDKPCATCAFMRLFQVGTGGAAGMQERCFRERTLRDGTAMPHYGVGSDCGFERDSYPEPQRVVGDKCGPEGRHWQGQAT